MVNDGSTDDSRRICEEWQARDARFRLLTVPNGLRGLRPSASKEC